MCSLMIHKINHIIDANSNVLVYEQVLENGLEQRFDLHKSLYLI